MRFLSENRVVARQELRREGARRWLRLEVARLAEAIPGQTVLFLESRHSPRCRTATVESVSADTTALVAKFEADDLSPKVGDALTIWSNETPAVTVGAGSLIVTTPPFLYRIEPFASLGAEVLVEEDGVDPWAELRRFVTEGGAWNSVFLALEPVRLQAFATVFPEADPWIFANMDMSCGIGACRSCHVNVSDNKDGEASCRVGPWFALKRVDLVRLQFSSAPFL